MWSYMKKLLLLLPILGLLAFANGTETPTTEGTQSVSLTYYNEAVQIEYDRSMLDVRSPERDDRSIIRCYEALERTHYQTLLNVLLYEKSRLQLNDWLYYDLMQRSVQRAMPTAGPLQQQITCWLLLTKSGYDARMTYDSHGAYLNIYTTEQIYESPMFRDGDKLYVNLSALHQQGGQRSGSLYGVDLQPNPSGRAFSFSLATLPTFRPRPVAKTISFSYKGEQIDLDITTDRNLRDLMDEYPIFDEKNYIETPFSELAKQSLLPQLRELITGKSQREAVQILLAFTRNAFTYKEDNKAFGKSKPMIAEEVLQYEYSDCEDRSAIFYMLVKELLDLPMVIIAYDDHMSIAVGLDRNEGYTVRHLGDTFTMCDPTGPKNSIAIGFVPKGYEHKSFEILGRHK